MLHSAKVPMAPKPFSMGVRIEHRQQAIDQSQYGPFAGHAALPAADYKLNCHLPDGSSAYTFCMCPGGVVVAAASELGGVVTNGMSYYARDLENANSALLVTLNPAEFPDKSVLGGMYWQQELERACFLAGGGNYFAPAQLVGDFLQNRPSTKLGAVQPTYRPGVTLCNLADILPQKLTLTLRQALQTLDQRLSGFACPDAVLTAPGDPQLQPCADSARRRPPVCSPRPISLRRGRRLCRRYHLGGCGWNAQRRGAFTDPERAVLQTMKKAPWNKVVPGAPVAG